MAYSFGEVRDEFSRALYCDDSEEFETPEINFEWEPEPNDFTCNLLLIIEVASMRKFFDKTILHDKEFMHELKPKSNIRSVRLFKVPSTNDIICFSEETDNNKSARITELLQPWIENAENIVAFTIQSIVYHNATISEEEILARRYFRAINSQIDSIKPLEIPNFVTGLSGGVLSLCNHIDKQSTCYILFTDDMLTSDTSQILKLIKKIGVPCSDSDI